MWDRERERGGDGNGSEVARSPGGGTDRVGNLAGRWGASKPAADTESGVSSHATYTATDVHHAGVMGELGREEQKQKNCNLWVYLQSGCLLL